MANHTSPIDVIILASDGYYAMVSSAPQPCLHWEHQVHCMGQGVGSKRLWSIAGCSQPLCPDTFSLGLRAPGVSRHCFASRALGFAIHGSAKHFPAGSLAVREALGLATSALPSKPGTSPLSLSRAGVEAKELPWLSCVFSCNLCLLALFRWVRSTGGSWG